MLRRAKHPRDAAFFDERATKGLYRCIATQHWIEGHDTRSVAAEGSMTSLTGQLLVAMPQMQDPRFARSVVYICAHSEDAGAMGLVVNKPLGSLTMGELLTQLEIASSGPVRSHLVHFGGPVETGRGFVLHTSDYNEEATLVVGDNIALTATLDILRAISEGRGPRRSLFALGYAGWGPGQLDAEIQANGWLSVAADDGIIFDPDYDRKWNRALAKLGVDLTMLSSDAGHA
jgi:putative transcriptional regulator